MTHVYRIHHNTGGDRMYQANASRYETIHYNRCGQSGLKLP